jgi:hypothetical protein
MFMWVLKQWNQESVSCLGLALRQRNTRPTFMIYIILSATFKVKRKVKFILVVDCPHTSKTLLFKHVNNIKDDQDISHFFLRSLKSIVHLTLTHIAGLNSDQPPAT